MIVGNKITSLSFSANWWNMWQACVCNFSWYFSRSPLSRFLKFYKIKASPVRLRRACRLRRIVQLRNFSVNFSWRIQMNCKFKLEFLALFACSWIFFLFLFSTLRPEMCGKAQGRNLPREQSCKCLSNLLLFFFVLFCNLDSWLTSIALQF